MNIRATVSVKILNADERHDLVTDKKVKEKNQYQRRSIADKLHITETDQFKEQPFRCSANSHQQAEQDGNKHPPYAELNGDEESLEQGVCYPPLLFLVKSNHIGRDNRPVPIVVQTVKKPVADIPGKAQHAENSEGVEQGDFSGRVTHVILNCLEVARQEHYYFQVYTAVLTAAV